MTCTEKRFLRDVQDHQMTIIRDDGVHRHIRFQKPGSTNMFFDLITWPGHLCYTGDMGTFVFQRLQDMFEFFRADRKQKRNEENDTLAINPAYWGEKLEAIDRSAGFRKWSEATFDSRVREEFGDWLDNGELSEAQKSNAREDFENNVIDAIANGKDSAYRAALDFEFEGERPFEDWWEVDTDEYTFHFLWCCYALAWGVERYDEAKALTIAV